jgi:16S rRNA processing protein RimM
VSSEPQLWVTLARILRPRGNKGEVAAVILTDFPERLTFMREVFLSDGKSEPRAVRVQKCWLSQNHRGQVVFHFADCNSINQAEKFRGLEVQIPFAQRVVLPVGHFFIEDLVGCSVFENPAQHSAQASPACSAHTAPLLLGTVTDVEVPGEGLHGTPTLSVDTAAGELLIPLALDICTRIDTAAKRIEVTLPEGLRELNDEA